MFPLTVGVISLIVIIFIVKRNYEKKSIEKKLKELNEVKMSEEVLDIEEQIVDSKISLKDRNKKLNVKKEKL